MKYVLSYETAPGGLARAPALFPAHRARWQAFRARGELLMIGPFEDPAQGALAIFTTREAAEAFAAGDPSVTGGVVGRWRVQGWDEALA